MQGSKVVVGVYTYLDDAIRAIEIAKSKQIEYRVYSPVPHHDLEEVTLPGKSPVRFFTAVGAILGMTGGYALAILTSLDYPLRVSAKNIVSPPGFFVIGYECTILFGALATLGAMFHFCKLPYIFSKPGYDPRFSQDKFGVVLSTGVLDVKGLEELHNNSGADEVQVRSAL
jgi:hypothetical protein